MPKISVLNENGIVSFFFLFLEHEHINPHSPIQDEDHMIIIMIPTIFSGHL